jgi:2,3-bisphosphoglycerate-independent phosphoglycerate mutase
MGNSEVGHLNLGAGRIVYQDLTRINLAIRDGSFARQPALQEAVQQLRESGGKLHLVGLMGEGGVHSHSDHLYALLQWRKRGDRSGGTCDYGRP